MSTVINNPSTGTTQDSGSNMLMGVVLVIILLGAVALFFIYGLPYIQNNSNQNPGTTNINVTTPAPANPSVTP